MAVLLLLAALFTVAHNAGAADLGRAPRWEERMLDAINAERAQRGLRPYRHEPRLDDAAVEHSRRMARANRLAHELPGEPRLRDRIAAAGLRFDAVAENVAYSTRVEELHSNLMGSPQHRDNLLSSKYDAVGIAIVQSGARYWVTQDFAHTTSEASVPEAEDDFAAAINELRRRRRLPPVEATWSPALRDAACAMASRDRLDTKLVPAQRGQRHVVVFTTFEPGEIEGTARDLATEPDVDRIIVGACSRATRRYPSGAYWFAVTY